MFYGLLGGGYMPSAAINDRGDKTKRPGGD
jgi:hypothetical protein